MKQNDPYANKLVTTDFYAQKLPLKGRVVAVLRGTVYGRDLQLIPQPSRAIRAGEIHEFIATEEPAAPGTTVSRVAYLCFVEFENGGVILQGDRLILGGRLAGTVAGFDLSHHPNHINIVVRAEPLISGEEMGLECGDTALVAASSDDVPEM